MTLEVYMHQLGEVVGKEGDGKKKRGVGKTPHYSTCFVETTNLPIEEKSKKTHPISTSQTFKIHQLR